MKFEFFQKKEWIGKNFEMGVNCNHYDGRMIAERIETQPKGWRGICWRHGLIDYKDTKTNVVI